MSESSASLELPAAAPFAAVPTALAGANGETELQPTLLTLLDMATELVRDGRTREAIAATDHAVAFLQSQAAVTAPVSERLSALLARLKALVQAAKDRGDPRAALDLLRALGRTGACLGDWASFVDAGLDEAAVLANLQEHDAALRKARRVEQVCRSFDDKTTLARLLFLRAWCLHRSNHDAGSEASPDGWRASWREALQLAREARALCPPTEGELIHHLARLIQTLVVVERAAPRR
jgi:hypothetical protein